MLEASRICHCVICHDYGDRGDYDPGDHGVIENVGQFGWSVTGVPADEEGPGWAYTIGRRHSRGEPELAMFGLDVGVMQSCLNTLGRRDDLADGQSHDGVINGYPLHLREVEPDWFRAFFGQAMWFYRRPPVPVLQVVWPDRQGAFPWDTGSLAQPHLWLTPEKHPPGVWTQDV
ncbi:DUF4262 domain-containing protein [Actinoplanes sp. TRM 88003]|uniref:DUF4262 domain-containing protein n=1 Tax=Paractinoplanes aksuensis TaxID=2939490 RepID=A0ABT1E4A7_9ACTN|nr:DUF4262 domain-containing protein [Actinoplanes aksuensis]MCO8277949.1 DUF4262 domain-containing protein [Actinoplanes aksuensis]